MRALPLALGKLVAWCAALGMTGASVSCELPSGGTIVASPDASVRLSFRPDPSPLALDRHFSLVVDICAAPAVTALTVDAQMPAHRHGMNYKPAIARTGPARWRADGLLLHMPGRWEFRFDARIGERTERLTAVVDLE